MREMGDECWAALHPDSISSLGPPPTGDRPVPEVREALPEVKHRVVQRGHGPPNIPAWGVGERGTRWEGGSKWWYIGSLHLVLPYLRSYTYTCILYEYTSYTYKINKFYFKHRFFRLNRFSVTNSALACAGPAGGGDYQTNHHNISNIGENWPFFWRKN